jgi:hypothetical protein
MACAMEASSFCCPWGEPNQQFTHRPLLNETLLLLLLKSLPQLINAGISSPAIRQRLLLSPSFLHRSWLLLLLN